ncbi:MAG: phytanoyl-CoA dioxygenase family protein [Candidatus Latescibacteria bacterium]|nr:phytanoyl-CoA dioxygenase family protein [Candidatus Latescibacterota bacterium]
MPHPLHLTAADVDFYRDNGYYVYGHPLFPQDKFSALKDFFEDLLAQLPTDKRPEAMDVPHFAHPELFDWLLADEVLDFVEAFLGPDIALWSSHFICKPPGDGRRVPWHEDSAYWKPRLDRHEVLTVWLAIDDSTPENGCMRVISGTHTHGFSDYAPVDEPDKHVFGAEILPEQVDQSRLVDLELQAGQCHIHHSRTIHGSNANTSAKRRCGYTMRYMPSSVRILDTPQAQNHAIYLARGRDLAGNSYGEPGQRFEPGIR